MTTTLSTALVHGVSKADAETIMAPINELRDALDAAVVQVSATYYPVRTGEVSVTNTLYPYGNVFRYGAVGTGLVDDTSAAQAAFTSIAALGGGTVTFPGGFIYAILTSVTGSSRVNVAAADARFTCGTQSSGKLFDLTGAQGVAYPLTINGVEGAVTVTVSTANAALLVANQHVWLYDTTLDNGADYVRERNIVKSVDGATGIVTLKYPLNFAYSTAASASLYPVTPIQDMAWTGGLFDMTGSTGEFDPIQVTWGYRVTVSGVAVTKHTGKAVQCWDSLFCTVRDVVATQPTDVTAGRGYGVQFIYCRSCHAENVMTEDCRHCVDVSGGSDITVVGGHSVCGNLQTTAAFHTHGLRAKRVTFVGGSVIGASTGYAFGNGTFHEDYDITVTGFSLDNCETGLFVTRGTVGVRFTSGTVKNSVVRAIAIGQGIDVVVDEVAVDGILTNPSNYAAVTVDSASDRVTLHRVTIKNAIYKALNFDGAGDFDVIDCDVDHAGTSGAVTGASLTGRLRFRGGTYRYTGSGNTFNLAGVATLTEFVNVNCIGGASQPATHVKVFDSLAPIVRGGYFYNAAELIRLENVGTPIVQGCTLDTGSNGVRLSSATGSITAARIDKDVVFRNLTGNPITNSTSSKLIGRSRGCGDADVTWTWGQDAEVLRFDTTLTANRTVSIDSLARNRANGARLTVIRTGLGAFTLTVKISGSTTLKVIPSATAARVDVECDDTTWQYVDYHTI